jgi:hypothetical protein
MEFLRRSLTQPRADPDFRALLDPCSTDAVRAAFERQVPQDWEPFLGLRARAEFDSLEGAASRKSKNRSSDLVIVR